MDFAWLPGLLSRMAMPLPVGLGLVIVAGSAAYAWRHRPGLRCAALGLAILGILLLWVASLSWTQTALFRFLEAPYPPRPAAACGAASGPVDAIVLLGGAIKPRGNRGLRGQLHRGSDRIREAALLFHAGCAPVLLVSAGSGVGSGNDAGNPLPGSEAHAIRELLQELGVPDTALIFEDDSRTTRENARYSAAVLGTADKRPRILLVTSAWHLRRAVPLFERSGFEVLPVGADRRGDEVCTGLSCILPDSRSLDANTIAWREILGYWLQVSGSDD